MHNSGALAAAQLSQPENQNTALVTKYTLRASTRVSLQMFCLAKYSVICD